MDAAKAAIRHDRDHVARLQFRDEVRDDLICVRKCQRGFALFRNRVN